MIIDCGTCEVAGDACHDCVVTVLLGPPGAESLGDEHAAAIAVLADAGLVPPLRLVARQPDDVGRAAARPARRSAAS